MFSPRDQQLMRKWVLGGAAAGGSVGLITSLINYLGAIKEEQEPPNKLTDDTLYLNLRKKKDKQASLAGAGALAGGTISALGSYALVRYLYQKMKKKELESQLAAEQQGYLDLNDQAKPASAAPPLQAAAAEGEPMKWPETLLSFPGALAVILGLGSAAVTNSLLKKTFPPPKLPGRRAPRRVVIRDLDKEASVEDGIEDTDGVEFLLRLLMSNKSAALSPFQDLIHGIAQGRHDEMAQALVDFGIDTVHDIVKGASLTPLEEPQLSMAIGAAARSPVWAPTIELLAASEFNDHFPTHFKWASVLPEEQQEALCKIAGITATGLRMDAMTPQLEAFEKEGGMGGFMMFDALKDALVLNSLSKVNKKPKEETDSTPAGSESDEPDPDDKTKVVADDHEAEHFKKKHEDIIDSALQ